MMENIKKTNIIISLITSFVFMVLGAVIATATTTVTVNFMVVKVFVVVARDIGIAISVLNAFLFIYWSCNLGYKLWLDNKLII